MTYLFSPSFPLSCLLRFDGEFFSFQLLLLFNNLDLRKITPYCPTRQRMALTMRVPLKKERRHSMYTCIRVQVHVPYLCNRISGIYCRLSFSFITSCFMAWLLTFVLIIIVKIISRNNLRYGKMEYFFREDSPFLFPGFEENILRSF